LLSARASKHSAVSASITPRQYRQNGGRNGTPAPNLIVEVKHTSLRTAPIPALATKSAHGQPGNRVARLVSETRTYAKETKKRTI